MRDAIGDNAEAATFETYIYDRHGGEPPPRRWSGAARRRVQLTIDAVSASGG
jgi:hypothetical protein